MNRTRSSLAVALADCSPRVGETQALPRSRINTAGRPSRFVMTLLRSGELNDRVDRLQQKEPRPLGSGAGLKPLPNGRGCFSPKVAAPFRQRSRLLFA